MIATSPGAPTCRVPSFSCAYHGWTYRNDGLLRASSRWSGKLCRHPQQHTQRHSPSAAGSDGDCGRAVRPAVQFTIFGAVTPPPLIQWRRAVSHRLAKAGQREVEAAEAGCCDSAKDNEWNAFDWISWFVDAADSVQTIEGWASIERRLRQPDRFEEALSVIQVAERFQYVGLSVAFDRKVDVNPIWPCAIPRRDASFTARCRW
jgi:hypothetical protein